MNTVLHKFSQHNTPVNGRLRRTLPSLLVLALILLIAPACKKEADSPNNNSMPRPTPTPVKGGVYFLSNPDGTNKVAAFSRDFSTGLVTYMGSFASGGNGTTAIQGSQAHAVVTNEEFLYAVNSGSDNFSVFRIGTDGRPSLLATTPSGGVRPVSIAIHGNLLYVLNQGIPAGDEGGPVNGGLSGFRIGTNGIPVAMTAATYPLDSEDMPSDIFFTGNGLRLAVLSSLANAVSSFDVDGIGLLSNLQSIDVGSQPVGGAATSRLPWTGFAAVVEDPGNASVVSFLTDAALAIVSQIPADTDKDPCWAVASVGGARLWTSNFLPQSLTLYSIAADSQLTRAGAYEPGPNPSAPGSLDVDVSSDGRFLYRLRAFNADGSPTPPHPYPVVEVFQINSNNDNGGLTLIQSAEVRVDSLRFASPTGMAVSRP